MQIVVALCRFDTGSVVVGMVGMLGMVGMVGMVAAVVVVVVRPRVQAAGWRMVGGRRYPPP